MTTDRHCNTRGHASPSGRHWVSADGTRAPLTVDATIDQHDRVPAYKDAPEDETRRLPELSVEEADALWSAKFLTKPPRPSLVPWIVGGLIAVAIVAAVYAIVKGI